MKISHFDDSWLLTVDRDGTYRATQQPSEAVTLLACALLRREESSDAGREEGAKPHATTGFCFLPPPGGVGWFVQ